MTRAPSVQSRRGELLVVAGAVFARRGAGNTTMRDIADEAGILAGSLYHHFKSKDALLEEVLRGVLEELTARYTAVRDADLDPIEAMQGLFVVAFDFVVHHSDVTSIVVNDSTYLHRVEGLGFVEAFSDGHRRIWTDVLRRGVTAGLFRPDLDLDLAYRAMMGSIVSAVRSPRSGPPPRGEELAAVHAALFLGGLVVPEDAVRPEGAAARGD
jgi:AcrR family transcriptional regulator